MKKKKRAFWIAERISSSSSKSIGEDRLVGNRNSEHPFCRQLFLPWYGRESVLYFFLYSFIYLFFLIIQPPLFYDIFMSNSYAPRLATTKLYFFYLGAFGSLWIEKLLFMKITFVFLVGLLISRVNLLIFNVIHIMIIYDIKIFDLFYFF